MRAYTKGNAKAASVQRANIPQKLFRKKNIAAAIFPSLAKFLRVRDTMENSRLSIISSIECHKVHWNHTNTSPHPATLQTLYVKCNRYTIECIHVHFKGKRWSQVNGKLVFDLLHRNKEKRTTKMTTTTHTERQKHTKKNRNKKNYQLKIPYSIIKRQPQTFPFSVTFCWFCWREQERWKRRTKTHTQSKGGEWNDERS